MFAQADVEEKIGYYITSDAESEKMITFLSLSDLPVLDFEFVNIETKHTTQFGLLDL